MIILHCICNSSNNTTLNAISLHFSYAPPLCTTSLRSPFAHLTSHSLFTPLHLFSKNHLSASLCAPPLKPLTLSLLLLSELFLWMDGRTHTRGGIGERTERAEWEIKQAVPLWTLIAPFSVPPLHFLSLNLPLQLSLQLHLSLHLSLTYLCTSAMQSFLTLCNLLLTETEAELFVKNQQFPC